jgi:hypothetical protein
MLGFIRDHDSAYNFSCPRDVEQREQDLKLVWGTIAEALHPNQPALARTLANETFDLMRTAFDRPELVRIFQEEAKVPEAVAQNMATGYTNLVGTILGHGSMSVVEAMHQFQRAGMTPDEALGFALLIGLHHPNFPITLVHGFAKGLTAKTPSLAIPDRLLGPLLIRRGREMEDGQMPKAEKEAAIFRDAESLRIDLARCAADILGISHAEALLIAYLVDATDRLTAIRRNYPSAIDFRPGENGGAPSFVRWNREGAPRIGEIVKKFGLILTNMRPAVAITTLDHVAEFTLPAALATLIGACEKEVQVVVDVLMYVVDNQPRDMTATKVHQFEVLARAFYLSSTFELEELRSINHEILEYVGQGRIPGFSGLATNLDADIALVHKHAMEIGSENRHYYTVSYLLSALVAMRTGNANQATLKTLARVQAEAAAPK